jgi:Tfp pilus assembly protein PilN
MPQQINLYSPILLTPKRYFSALAMGQALAAFTAALLALSAWSAFRTVTLRRDLQSTTQAQQGERQRLKNALANQPVATSPAALEQELATENRLLAERQKMLAELSRGLVTEGRSHSAWLRLLAQTVPAPVWLTEVTLGDGRVELAGATLQPDALRPWLAKLGAHPLAAGRGFSALKLERSEAGGAPGVPGAAGAETWVFQVANGGVLAAPAAGAVPGVSMGASR